MAFALRLSPLFKAVALPRFDEAPARGFRKARSGTAAVEFAIVGPVLILLMLGMVTYGGYFLTAHTVQQLANDAARAAIAGLDDDERLLLARESATASLASQAFMRGQLSQLDVRRTGENMAISVTYDAREDVYWSFESLLPVPSPDISRTATIRLGGL
jgi:Flp pilus assembly protein TadG